MRWQTRLRQRLQALLFLVLLAFLLSFLFWLLLQVLQPFLPAFWQHEWRALQEEPLRENLGRLKRELGSQPLLPLYFVLLQAGQVVLAPIPGQVMGLLGGWFFGFWQGLSLTMLGLGVGSALAMLLGRFGGRPLLERLLPHELLLRFDHMSHNAGLFTFFMLFLLPALPDDALCLIAGLTGYSLPWLLLVCILGRLPGMAVLTWVGTELGETSPSMRWILLGLGLVSVLLWFFQDAFEARFAHWSQQRRKGQAPQTPSAPSDSQT